MVSRIYMYRHAHVLFDNSQRLPMSDFRIATDLYNTAPLAPYLPPQPIPPCDYVITSALRRSADTAIDLFGFIDINDVMFREADLPDLPNWPIKARPTTFFAIARLFWFFGWTKNCETKRAFLKRSELAAGHLIRAAQDYGNVAFVGHGWFNRALSRVLVARDFHPATKPQHLHGNYTLFEGPKT